MKQNIYKGEWVGCSDFQERRNQAKANHNAFVVSDLKKRLDAGWQLTKTTVKHKRPRIKKENFKIVMVFGKPMKLTIQEYNDHWNFRIDK